MSGNVSPNPFVFIVGCPRSGTTLLERMVNAHPSVAIMHESHWILRFHEKRIGLTRNGLVTGDFVEQLAEHHRFHLLKMTRQDLMDLFAASGPVPYAEFVSRLFDLYAQREGKRLAGDKSTAGYLRNMPLLHELFPQARFVNLLRDGRDICLSMLSWPKADRAAGRLAIWKENPVATTALWWEWQVRLGQEGGAALDDATYYELRYEALVRQPAEQCAALCEFLGLPSDEAMLRFHEGRTSTEAGLSANRAWLPPTPDLRDWRTQMPEKDVELFEALGGELLSELGYERRFVRISPDVAAVAERFRNWWNTDRLQAPDRET